MIYPKLILQSTWNLNDASQVAYATVIFLRVETKGNVSVQLIQSKAKIAPMNKITISRFPLQSYHGYGETTNGEHLLETEFVKLFN